MITVYTKKYNKIETSSEAAIIVCNLIGQLVFVCNDFDSVGLSKFGAKQAGCLLLQLNNQIHDCCLY